MTLMTALTLNASGFNNGIDLAIKDTEDFKKAIGAASVETIKAFKDISEMGVGQMRKNLRELRNISFAGKSVEEIGAINKQIGVLQDTMGDTKALQAGLGTEFGNLATQGIQGMVGIAEAGLGLAMVLGMDKKQAAEYQATMVGVIGAVQGLGQFQEMLGNKVLQSIAIRIKETAATAADTAAKYANAAASRVMGAAMTVNPMMLAVAAAAALVVGIVALTGAFRDSRGAIDSTNESLKTTIELQLQAQKGALDLAAKNQLALLQIEKDSGKITAKDFENKKNALEKESALRAVEKSEKQALADFDKALKEEESKTYAMTGADYEKWETKKREILQDFGLQKAEIIKQEYLQNKIVSLGIDPIKGQAKAVREVKDAWVEAYEKAQELAQFDVPQYRDPNAAPVGKTAGKTEIGPTASPDFLNGLKARHAAYVKSLDKELSEAAKAAQKHKEIDDATNAAKITALSDTFGIAAGLFEKNTIAYKLMAAAQAGMDTYRAANVALASAPPPFNFALMGVTIAAGLMNVAKIAGFANGGIVPGASFSGDKINARLNSGEMVLNASQQSNLFALANGGTGSAGGSVRFEIEGTKLVGVLSNTGRKNKNTR